MSHSPEKIKIFEDLIKLFTSRNEEGNLDSAILILEQQLSELIAVPQENEVSQDDQEEISEQENQEEEQISTEHIEDKDQVPLAIPDLLEEFEKKAALEEGGELDLADKEEGSDLSDIAEVGEADPSKIVDLPIDESIDDVIDPDDLTEEELAEDGKGGEMKDQIEDIVQEESAESPPTFANFKNTKPSIRKNIPINYTSYQAKNAQVAVNYYQALADLGLNDIEVVSLEGENHSLDEIGLNYNPENSSIEGTPAQAGEFAFIVKYKLKDGGNLAGSLTQDILANRKINLYINPDPRSLWKVLEPPEDSPFRKPHFRFAQARFDELSIYGASMRGRSHAHAATHRDDDFTIEKIAENILFIAVADGAGSAQYSREGSRLVCEACVRKLRENTEALAQFEHLIANYTSGQEQNFSSLAYQIVGDIVKESIDALHKSAEDNGHALKDYSTTLLFTIICKRESDYCIVSYGVGDGIAATVNDKDEIQLLTAPDSGTHAGQTRFITMSDTLGGIAQRIKVRFLEDVKNTFLMTDGISDVYFETDSKLEDLTCWEKLKGDMNTHVDFGSETQEEQFEEWINFFSKGNHDDRTIVWIR